MRGLRGFLFVGMWFCLLPVAQAVELTDLYSAEIPVVNQSIDERKQAIKRALVRVLVKVSGNAQITLTPGIPNLLKQANRYVVQYRYQSRALPPAIDAPAPLPATSETILRVQFSDTRLGSALQGLSIPVWGRARPATLVWIAYDTQGERGIVSENQQADLQARLSKAAELRGMPLLWPLLDLEDQTRISFADVWAGFQDRIQAASVRYEVQSILVGRLLNRSDDFWDARWELLTESGNSNWQSAGNIDELLEIGVNTATDTLASLYVRAADIGVSQLQIKITDLQSASDYAVVERFVRKLEPVETLELLQLQANTAMFSLKLKGTDEDFQQALELSNIKPLVRVETAAVGVGVTGNTNPAQATGVPQTQVLTYRFIQ